MLWFVLHRPLRRDEAGWRISWSLNSTRHPFSVPREETDMWTPSLRTWRTDRSSVESPSHTSSHATKERKLNELNAYLCNSFLKRDSPSLLSTFNPFLSQVEAFPFLYLLSSGIEYYPFHASGVREPVSTSILKDQSLVIVWKRELSNLLISL